MPSMEEARKALRTLQAEFERTGPAIAKVLETLDKEDAAWLRKAAAELTPGSATALAYLAEADKLDPQ